MELRILRNFLAVVDEGNITKAAELLHITQPALSRQMMDLEHDLGVRLFNRGKYNITLTPDGTLLRSRARELVSLADKMEQDLRRRNEVLSGAISFGLCDDSSAFLLSNIARDFCSLNQDVSFELNVARETKVLEQVEHGVLDFGLVSGTVNTKAFDYIKTNLLAKPVLVVRQDSPLVDKAYVTPEDLVGIPMVLPSDIPKRPKVVSWFGKTLDKMKVYSTYNVDTIALQMVQSGLGSTIYPQLYKKGAKVQSLQDEYFASMGLQFIPLRPEINFELSVIWEKRHVMSPAAKALIEYLRGSELGSEE